MHSLGDCYERGWGVEQSLEQAVALYQQAAEHKNACAMAAMGRLYLFGDGVEQDFTAAFRLLHESAEMGNSDGGYFLAKCFWEGLGTSPNPDAARNACEKALADKDFNYVKPAAVRKLLKQLNADETIEAAPLPQG